MEEQDLLFNAHKLVIHLEFRDEDVLLKYRRKLLNLFLRTSVWRCNNCVQNVCKRSFKFSYDRERAAGRLDACQCVIMVSTVSTMSLYVTFCSFHGNGSYKKWHLRIKKAPKGRNAMKILAGGRKRITTLEEDRYVSLEGKKNINAIPSQIAGGYQHTWFCRDNFTPIKLSLFVCMKACSIHTYI